MAKEEHEFTGSVVSLSPWMLLSAHAGWKQAELRSVHLLLIPLLLPDTSGAAMYHYTPLGTSGLLTETCLPPQEEILAVGGESRARAGGNRDESPQQLRHFRLSPGVALCA